MAPHENTALVRLAVMAVPQLPAAVDKVTAFPLRTPVNAPQALSLTVRLPVSVRQLSKSPEILPAKMVPAPENKFLGAALAISGLAETVPKMARRVAAEKNILKDE